MMIPVVTNLRDTSILINGLKFHINHEKAIIIYLKKVIKKKNKRGRK